MFIGVGGMFEYRHQLEYGYETDSTWDGEVVEHGCGINEDETAAAAWLMERRAYLAGRPVNER